MQKTTNNLMSLSSDTIKNQKTNYKSRYKSAEIESPAVREMTGNIMTKGNHVQYYLDLCKEFPNIAFRMSDQEASMAAGNPGPGYERNSYQSNPDYSNPETCSIDIDVKILKRMMNDSDFEMKIKGMISTRESNYDTYVNDAMNSTYGFGHIFIQEEKGELVTGFALYHFKASTDEEIKLMYADKSKDYTKNQQSIHIVKNSTQDTFIKMLDKSRLKMNYANELTKEKLLDQALSKD